MPGSQMVLSRAQLDALHAIRGGWPLRGREDDLEAMGLACRDGAGAWSLTDDGAAVIEQDPDGFVRAPLLAEIDRVRGEEARDER